MRKVSSFEQAEPSRVWTYLVPEPNIDIVVVGVFYPNGRSTHDPSTYTASVQDGMIKIDLGINEEFGHVVYEYDDGQPEEEKEHITINNNINCGGTTPCGSTF